MASWIMTMDGEPALGLRRRLSAVVLGQAAGDKPRSARVDGADGLALSEDAIRPVLRRAQLCERRAFGHADSDQTCGERRLGDTDATGHGHEPDQQRHGTIDKNRFGEGERTTESGDRSR